MPNLSPSSRAAQRGKPVASRAHRVPAVLGLEVDRRRDREVRRRIARAGPAMPDGPLVGGPVPAHGARLEQRLRFGADVEKAGAFRRAEPLMTIAGVEVRTERREVEVDLPGRVRAVDDREHAGLASPRAELLGGKAKRRRRRDVTEEQRARSRRDGPEQIVHGAGRRRVDLDVARTAALARVPPEQSRCRRTRASSRRSRRRAAGRASARRRSRPVVAFGTSTRSAADAPTYAASRSRARPDQLRKTALEAEKLDRIPLELELKALILGEHRSRAGAERPVVEEDDLGIEQKELTHVNIA